MDPNKTLTEQDIRVLLSFLSDPSQSTAALAKRQLKEALSRRPEFRGLLQASALSPATPELTRFLEETRLEETAAAFQMLAGQGDFLDLEFGAYTLAAMAYPQLTRKEISEPLDRMAEALDERIDAAESEDSEETVSVLRSYFFEELGFYGNERNFYDPDNSFLHRVIERRTGIPISLACVYLLVGWRLDLPVYGIGLPGHFIIGHQTLRGPVYLDAFYGGRMLGKPDCIELVRQRGLRFQDSFLEPTPPRQILCRMMVNLLNIYTEQGAADRAQWLSQGLQVLQGSHE
jgi:regulator of sirC expression with transglutaminase-like and TPR domain